MANVTINWDGNPPTDNVEGYRVYGANGTSTAFGSCSLLATVAGLTWTDTGVPNGQTRTYYIVAFNAVGDSAPDGPLNITAASASSAYVQNLGGAPSLEEGVHASRPAAGNAGAVYLETDTRTLWRDNGTGWDELGGGGALPTIGSGDVLGNSTSGSGPATDTTLTALLDRAFGSTQGNILYRAASSWAVLAPGTSGEVLQTNGSGADPTWAAASDGGGTAGGALTLVEEHTANNTSTEMDFTSWYSSSYDTYKIEIVNLVPGTNNTDFVLEVSTNGGLSYDQTSGHYEYAQYRFYSGAGAAIAGSTSTTNISVTGGLSVLSNSLAVGGVTGSLTLYNPGSSAVYKRVIYDVTYGATTTSNAAIRFVSFGTYLQTAAVNAFRIRALSGNISSGVVRVYGLSK